MKHPEQRKEVLEKIREYLYDDKIVDNPGDVTEKKRLIEDLKLDSLDQVEFFMFLEEAYGIIIPTDVSDKVNTIGQAITVVVDRIPH